MSRKSTVQVAMLALLLATLGACSAQGSTTATAELKDTEGDPVGAARFTEGEQGVEIVANVERGLRPGEHGIHIHEKGSITPNFEAAGGHFNPRNVQHGFENPQGPHSGDLANITVDGDGTASYRTVTDRVTLSDGRNSLLDEDGSALVIHAWADDFKTDPSGNSGDRVVAGVIEAADGSGTGLLLPLVALVVIVGVGLLVWRTR
jgi:superoxide dismutase, Cu-Zn family